MSTVAGKWDENGIYNPETSHSILREKQVFSKTHGASCYHRVLVEYQGKRLALYWLIDQTKIAAKRFYGNEDEALGELERIVKYLKVIV